ncbi:MAG TPA: YbaN family protein [Bacillota bacterium]|nr:YbaN family protein [Bacillota bacterium]
MSSQRPERLYSETPRSRGVRTGWRLRPTRLVFLIAGTAALGLGTAGAFLPGVPTTPFLLLSAACYTRSSDRMYRWLVGHPRFGRPIRQLLAGQGLPLPVKVWSLGLAYLFLGLTATFGFHQVWVRLLLLAAALVKTYYLLFRLPTAKE